jgi:hypothetical protein
MLRVEEKSLPVRVRIAILTFSRPVFPNRRAAARYRALASIILGRERISWNLPF